MVAGDLLAPLGVTRARGALPKLDSTLEALLDVSVTRCDQDSSNTNTGMMAAGSFTDPGSRTAHAGNDSGRATGYTVRPSLDEVPDYATAVAHWRSTWKTISPI